MEGQPPAPTAPVRRNNLRHIVIVALLSVLALGVAGAIIYFTLHVTGVIDNLNGSGTTATLTEEEKAAQSFANNHAALKERILALKDDPNADDPSLESDLQNFLGQAIENYGKDSEETLQATLLLTDYYDYVADYDIAKDYLEDRLSVLDDDTTQIGYLTELYRLASKNDDTETANKYLNQLNGSLNGQSENAQKAKIAYDIALNIYLSYINKEHISDDAVLQQMLDYAYQAEELNPTGDTAALIWYIEKQFGDEGAASKYKKLAAERDPENYEIGDGENDAS